MIFQVRWTTLSESSFSDEIEFIFKKWNLKEVNIFISLVEEYISLLQINPKMGTFLSQKDIYALVISKQTTLFYKIIHDKNQIDLILFWNNKKNPRELAKFL